MSDSSSAPQPKRPTLAQRLRLPEVSGKWTAFWLLFCLVVTGLLIPLVLKKPLWIELEFVVAAWWLMWSIVLTKLLYKGKQIADDYQIQDRKPRNWSGLFDFGDLKSERGSTSGGRSESLFIMIGLFIVLITVGLVVIVLIEFILPTVFFMLYFITRSMLIHVAHDRPQCRGNLRRSTFRGFMWAAVYTAPLAGIVWLGHLSSK